MWVNNPHRLDVASQTRSEVLTADPLPSLRLPVFTCYGADPGTPLTWISRDSKKAYAAGCGLRVTQPTTQQLEAWHCQFVADT